MSRRLFYAAVALVLATAIPAISAAQAPGSNEPAGAQSADSSPTGESGQPSADGEGDGATELPVRLLERAPFDRITLNEASGGQQIETTLLDLPDRQVPQPLPTEGTLEIRQVSQPTIAYAVDWSSIAKIELYEQMLLEEARRLTAAGEFAAAFEYLALVSEHYPNLAGLEEARQSHLWREASDAYASGRHEEAWAVLSALYQRNAQFPRLVNAVQSVSDSLVASNLKAKDYRAARAIVDSLETDFRNLPLSNIATWRSRFQADANAQIAIARDALAAERYSDARAAIAHARSILPDVAGGEELWRRIQAEAPEIRVGVTQWANWSDDDAPPIWAATRLEALVAPRLVELVDFGSEGGVYACRWGEIRTSDDGLQTAVRLSPAAIERQLLPSAVARQLAAMGNPSSRFYHEDFAAQVSQIELAAGTDAIVYWRRPPVRPEALLRAPLRRLTTADRSPGMWFEPEEEDAGSHERRFERPQQAGDQGSPRFIVEQIFPDDDRALAALVNDDIDVLERVAPWQLARLQSAEDIVVAPYRLPTVHVLIPNQANPLMELREFRRAICYGVDAEGIVRDIILGGGERPGFRPVSGPFAVGVELNDPVGYAYNTQLQPRPYEPRLAALLAGLARATLAKRSGEGGNSGAGVASAAPAVSGEEAAADAAEIEDQMPPPEPLVLAHPADGIARLACEAIKLQLDQVGIPVKLVEFQGARPTDALPHDLCYAELTAWEPLVDARRVLGADGLAGRSSALMVSALDELSRAENWSQAAAKLKEIHRIAHYDLPVIPLWQTVNYLAYRREVSGIVESPVSLYQNVSNWRKSAH